jgi:DNA-binding beta-propeller fold protein YncE
VARQSEIAVSRRPIAALALGLVALLCLSGALLARSAWGKAVNAYVTDHNGAVVFQFGLDPGGLLSPLTPASLESGKTPDGVAISPDGKSVYVADFYVYGGVSQYDVGAGGLLSQKEVKTVVAGTDPESIAVSPDGKSVYVTNHGSKNVSQYDVGAGGALFVKSTETVAAEGGPSGIAVSPDGKSVYVDNQESGTVSQYDVGAGGLLSPKTVPKVPAGVGPSGIAISPDGRNVYVADQGGENVAQYDVGAGGLLSPKTPTTVPAGVLPDGVAVSPDGKSVYVTDREVGGTISQFDVGAGGALSAKTPARVPAGSEPLGIAISPDGRSAYAANLHGYVSQFAVGAGGLLAPKSPPTALLGAGPPAEAWGIAIPPDQAPTASFSAAPAHAGLPTGFDGSASSDPDGTVARYDWSFGDGTSAPDGGPTPTHVYASGGSYTVQLSVTDEAGCSASTLFTGQTAYCNGGAQASESVTVAVPAAPVAPILQPQPPVITGASLTNKRFRVGSRSTAISARRAPVGTTFRLTLSATASVQVVITRSVPGLRRGHGCLPPTTALRRAHAKHCIRTLTVSTLTRSREPAGADSIPFSGRIGRRALSPGAYVAVLGASDAAGRSRAVSLPFTIVR